MNYTERLLRLTIKINGCINQINFNREVHDQIALINAKADFKDAIQDIKEYLDELELALET